MPKRRIIWEHWRQGLTIREEQLLRDKAIAESTSIDGCAVESAYVAECLSGSANRRIIRDVIVDGRVERSAADLTRTADGDMRVWPGKHAPCEGVPKGQ